MRFVSSCHCLASGCAFVAIGLLTPVTARAQFALFEGVLSKFEYFNIGFGRAELKPRQRELTAGPASAPPTPGQLKHLSVEFAFMLAEFRELKPVSAKGSEAPKEPDTTFTVLERVVEKRHTADSVTTTKYSAKPREESPRPITSVVDLALGYSHQWGLASAVASVDFTGAIRELPNATVYVTFHNFDVLCASPYFGVRTGLAQLHQATFYTELDSVTRVSYGVSANTFQYGAVAGLIGAIPKSNLEVFAEFSYTHREFSGLNYAAKDNKVPTTLPLSLNASALAVTVGVQFDMPKKSP